MKKQTIAISIFAALLLSGCNESSSDTASDESSSSAQTASATTAQATESTQATSNSPAVAIVDGVPIPELRMNFYADVSNITEENRVAVIDNMITSELIAKWAKEQGFHLKEDVAQQLIVAEQTVLGRVFTEDFLQNNTVDEAALQQQYDEMAAAYADKIEYETDHILVDEEALANELLAKIKSNEGDFAELAKAHSKDPGSAVAGGSLGWIGAENLVPEFAQAMQQLEPGNVSETPVKTDYGWHIIRVKGQRQATPPPFETVKPQLQQGAQIEAFSKLLEELRAKSKIEIITQQ